MEKIYTKDFDYTRLEVQLETLAEYCRDNDEAKLTINSIIDTLREYEAKEHLSEVYKLLKLLLVLPATNLTSERTFSLMKIVKIYFRSTMKQERLNHLMILYAYKERLDDLDLNKIANEFISKNDSRRVTFGKPTSTG